MAAKRFDRRLRSQAGDRRVAGQGEDDRRLPRARTTSSSPRSATSATCPKDASDVPAAIKGEKWARLGVDVDNEFTPYYVVSRDKKPHMTKLKGLLKDASELYLATDEDREGEAIAWHLQEELKPKVPVRRMVFHEITKQAIQDAVRNPRDARPRPRRGPGGAPDPRPALRLRGLARCCGRRSCRSSRRAACSRWPPGWSSTGSVSGSRSASASYWDLEGTFDAGQQHSERMFPAKLQSIDGARVARGSDFDSLGAAARAPDGVAARRPGPRRGARRGAPRLHVRGPLGRVEALHPQALRAVPYDDAAAGGLPQARLRGQRGRCRSRSGCTRTASSPTCEPTRSRCRSRRSRRRGTRSASCTAPSTCPTRRGPTSRR